VSDGRGAGDGARLRLARQARGFTQEQLAGMAGVTRQAVSKAESGASDPSQRVALALARTLGMTVQELFGPAARRYHYDRRHPRHSDRAHGQLSTQGLTERMTAMVGRPLMNGPGGDTDSEHSSE
jgi:transcriptional regulator with XRE-family HTH domain